MRGRYNRDGTLSNINILFKTAGMDLGETLPDGVSFHMRSNIQ